MELSLRFHAVFSAYLSIGAGLFEAVFAVIFTFLFILYDLFIDLPLYAKMIAGHTDISMSLYGIAIMAIVDITGSILVLIFWQGNDQSPSTERESPEKIRELQYSYVIGALMMLLGIFLILDR